MPNYRRTWVPGGTYFFTVNVHNRSSHLLVDHIEALRRAFMRTRADRPFHLHAAVVLPDHLHVLWTLPPHDADNALRWRQIKSSFTRDVAERHPTRASQRTRGESGLWQRRYWERLIRDEHDLNTHIDYIHYNPVRHGYVERACEWPYSSFHRFVRAGILRADWGTSWREFTQQAGGEHAMRVKKTP